MPSWKMASIFMNKKNVHALVAAIWDHQKMVESTGEFWTLWSKLSKNHFSCPFSSMVVHQRSPTRSLPVMFLTVQKSKERRMVTSMKMITSSLVKSPKNR